MEIVFEAIGKNDKCTIVQYGYIHNGKINDFDYEEAIEKLKADGLRVLNIEIKL